MLRFASWLAGALLIYRIGLRHGFAEGQAAGRMAESLIRDLRDMH